MQLKYVIEFPDGTFLIENFCSMYSSFTGHLRELVYIMFYYEISFAAYFNYIHHLKHIQVNINH